MSVYGLQCWDSAGKLTVDVNDRLFKRLGRHTFNLTIPAKQALANLNISANFTLPAAFVGSGLEVWVHPTQRFVPNWVSVTCTSLAFTHSVSGTTLTVRLAMTGYSSFATDFSIEFEYGVY